MAELKLPTRTSWLDKVKKTGQLTIFFHDTLTKAGWGQVFKDAIAEFNKLSSSHKLGVKFAQGKVRDKADVEVHAARGDVEFEYLPDVPKTTIRFKGSATHGLCKTVLTSASNKAKVDQWKLKRAFIFVPAEPTGDRNGRTSPVGDGVKLVIAVHEMVHACGLVDNNEHSVDDLFCWPRLRMGNKPSEDKLVAKGGKYTFKGLPNEPPRVGYRNLEMPPLVLKRETAEKIRKLWA